MAAPTLSAEQKTAIKQLWEVVMNGDPQETGISMYMHMFKVQPEVMKMFSFVPKGVTNPEDLRESARFLRHANSLMASVNSAVDMLDDLNGLTEVLIDLGRRHKKYKAKPDHFPIVGRSLTHAVSTATGDAFTPERAEAFGALYGVITHYTTEGLVEAA